MRTSAVKMGLKVYYDLMSQPSRAVWIFVNANKIPFEDKPVALRKGEHLTEAFAVINPFQKVPVIEHNGFKLTESVAILQYLCREYGNEVADHWYPTESHARAKVDEFLSWYHTNLRIFAAMFFRTRVLGPAMGKPLNKPKLDEYGQRLGDCLDQMEKIFFENDYINGSSKITIADILAVCEIEQPRAAGYDIYQGRPKLAAYMQRVKDKMDPHYTMAHVVHGRLTAAIKAGKL